jgi:hypothetical protein
VTVGLIKFIDKSADVPSKVLSSLRAGVADALHRDFSDSAKFRFVGLIFFGSGGTEYPLENGKNTGETHAATLPRLFSTREARGLCLCTLSSAARKRPTKIMSRGTRHAAPARQTER